MKKLFVFLIAVLTLALMGCGGDAPKKDAAAPAGRQLPLKAKHIRHGNTSLIW